MILIHFIYIYNTYIYYGIHMEHLKMSYEMILFENKKGMLYIFQKINALK